VYGGVRGVVDATGTARITATLSFEPFKDLLLRTTVEVVGPAL
jgi:hypothetical protein